MPNDGFHFDLRSRQLYITAVIGPYAILSRWSLIFVLVNIAIIAAIHVRQYRAYIYVYCCVCLYQLRFVSCICGHLNKNHISGKNNGGTNAFASPHLKFCGTVPRCPPPWSPPMGLRGLSEARLLDCHRQRLPAKLALHAHLSFHIVRILKAYTCVRFP
jgi:hypothetical protein